MPGSHEISMIKRYETTMLCKRRMKFLAGLTGVALISMLAVTNAQAAKGGPGSAPAQDDCAQPMGQGQGGPGYGQGPWQSRGGMGPGMGRGGPGPTGRGAGPRPMPPGYAPGYPAYGPGPAGAGYGPGYPGQGMDYGYPQPPMPYAPYRSRP
jgi:hypothetical protein